MNATSRIEQVVDGCAIRESYDSPLAPGGAYSGTSYSSFDAADQHWHQMYVDNHAHVTWYSGTLEAQGMVFLGPAQRGALQRMSYEPQADGSVRQIGKISTDGGKTWTDGYDYTYRRK